MRGGAEGTRAPQTEQHHSGRHRVQHIHAGLHSVRRFHTSSRHGSGARRATSLRPGAPTPDRAGRKRAPRSPAPLAVERIRARAVTEDRRRAGRVTEPTWTLPGRRDASPAATSAPRPGVRAGGAGPGQAGRQLPAPRLRRAGPPALRPGAGLRRQGYPPLDPGESGKASRPRAARRTPQAARPRLPGPGRTSGGALHLDQAGAARPGEACATESRSGLNIGPARATANGRLGSWTMPPCSRTRVRHMSRSPLCRMPAKTRGLSPSR